MPKKIPNKEVARRCLRRIQKWQHIPSFAGQERDWTFFGSAFPECQMRSDEILHGLELLQNAGFIRLHYPHPARDPEAFIVEYREEAVS